jgi:hypothetical protein
MDNAVREAFNRIWVEDEDIFTEQILANVSSDSTSRPMIF